MRRKEWIEVLKQSGYFLLWQVGMVLLTAIMDLIQKRPFKTEDFLIMQALMLLILSMLMGISIFAMDGKQKGVEYLLTLPIRRGRLLFEKLMPRLAVVIFFYLLYLMINALFGQLALAGLFPLFSLIYFGLFFISFSFSASSDNFVVLFILAGFYTLLYGAACLGILGLGYAWKTVLPFWLAYDFAFHDELIRLGIVVFALMALPFLVSFFVAFKKFDFRPVRRFNRRRLRLLVPSLVLAAATALGFCYLSIKKPSFPIETYLTEKHQLVRLSWTGNYEIRDLTGWRQGTLGRGLFGGWLMLEREQKLYFAVFSEEKRATSYDIVRFDPGDQKAMILCRIPDRFLVSWGGHAFSHYHNSFVFLERSRSEADRPGMQWSLPLKSDQLNLVIVNQESGETRKILFVDPLLLRCYQPRIFATDIAHGRRFWLIKSGDNRGEITRLWENGAVEDLGQAWGSPGYVNHLLFLFGRDSLQILRLLEKGTTLVKEITGRFKRAEPFRIIDQENLPAIFLYQDGQLVFFDLNTLQPTAVIPHKGFVQQFSANESFLIEPRRGPDPARGLNVYRLREGGATFLKKIAVDYGRAEQFFVGRNGIIVSRGKGFLAYAFPDLRELEFK